MVDRFDLVMVRLEAIEKMLELLVSAIAERQEADEPGDTRSDDQGLDG